MGRGRGEEGGSKFDDMYLKLHMIIIIIMLTVGELRIMVHLHMYMYKHVHVQTCTFTLCTYVAEFKFIVMSTYYEYGLSATVYGYLI